MPTLEILTTKRCADDPERLQFDARLAGADLALIDQALRAMQWRVTALRSRNALVAHGMDASLIVTAPDTLVLTRVVSAEAGRAILDTLTATAADLSTGR